MRRISRDQRYSSKNCVYVSLVSFLRTGIYQRIRSTLCLCSHLNEVVQLMSLSSLLLSMREAWRPALTVLTAAIAVPIVGLLPLLTPPIQGIGHDTECEEELKEVLALSQDLRWWRRLCGLLLILLTALGLITSALCAVLCACPWWLCCLRPCRGGTSAAEPRPPPSHSRRSRLVLHDGRA